jgi:hypothetical protein
MFITMLSGVFVLQTLLGPAFHWRAFILSFSVSLSVGVVLFWLAFRFGRIAWLAISVSMLSLGLALRFLSS